jgi:GGDEF domain-containing protein
MGNPDQKPKEEAEVKWDRVLDKSVFLFLIDLEVKRARRYQNFLCILTLKLNALSKDESGDLQTCYQMLTNLLTEEIRESDIIGQLSRDMVGVLLPYADVSAGNDAISRFEHSLKYWDFKHKGYEVMIGQVSFPAHETNTESLVKRVLEPGRS